MDDDRTELEELDVEAEAEGAEQLPPREAMSVINITGDLPPPPLAD